MSIEKELEEEYDDTTPYTTRIEDMIQKRTIELEELQALLEEEERKMNT